MIITASGKELELNFKTRLMERFEERFKIEDSLKFWKKAANGPSLKVLEIALITFSDGTIKNVNDADDFIDDYTAGGKTVYSLYGEIIKEINDKGFFKEKLTEEELKQRLEEPDIDMTEIVNQAVTEAGKEWISETGQSALKQAGPRLIKRG